MPRKTQPQGRPEKQDIQVDQKIKHEAFLYSNPPKGNLILSILTLAKSWNHIRTSGAVVCIAGST